MSKIFSNFIGILFIINVILCDSNEQLIENPKIILSGDKNPIVFNGNEQYYHIINTEKIYIIEKFTGNIKVINDSIPYSSSYFLCEDESNNHFLYSNKVYYKINLDINYQSIYLNNMFTISSDAKFVGCLKHIQYKKGNDLDIGNGEIIIYGKTGYDGIFFYYINKKNGNKINYSYYYNSIEENITCKLIYKVMYICGFFSQNKIRLLIIYLTKYSSRINLGREEKSIELLNTENTDNLVIFDTKKIDNKILCYRKIDKNNKNECFIFYLYFTDNTKEKYSGLDRPKLDIEFQFPFNEKNCDFTWFYSEYLFCCSDTNIISCYRLNDNYQTVDKFNLTINGENSNLKIINNTEYASLFYINENNEQGKKLYEYIIYPPVCQNISKEIIVFHDFEVNLTFDIKTRNSYYLQFYDLPEDYIILINGDELKEAEEIQVNQKESIFYFNPKNNNRAKNLTIKYKVSIEAKYSSTCKIDLTILPCYISCHKCFKWKSESDENNHNCLLNECEQDYFESPLNENNCYSLEEKNKSWYLDNTTRKFGICHEECFECSGPSNKDCISCYNFDINPTFSHLYKGQCLNDCPEGTYKTISNDRSYEFYICEDCYKNCKSCSQTGDPINMNCNSCINENDIKKGNNCYKLYENDKKTFYKPESMEITSCLQLFNNYIKDDSYECIDTYEDGYFISNPITGVISRCHSDCKTCSKIYNDTNSNCDTCKNEELYFEEGNCVSSCSIGYYLDGMICKKCHQNCHSCYSSQIILSNNLIDMQCIQCKEESPNMIKYENNCFHTLEYTEQKIIFNISEIGIEQIEGSCLYFSKSIRYGEYECKPKPDNTFYVIEGIDNTGIIKDCNEACNLCIAEADLTDTNCINCADGYAKTEDSFSNCILEYLIPKNYYKNETDSIYYRCYENCYNCTEKYNLELNDMHCSMCASNFYFLNGTNNCYNISFLIENKNYYLSDLDNIFYPCYWTCSQCLGKETNNEVKLVSQNCIECIDNYHLMYNSKDCYNDSILEEGYYLSNDSQYHKCDIQCKLCTEESDKCIICNYEEGYYISENKPI